MGALMASKLSGGSSAQGRRFDERQRGRAVDRRQFLRYILSRLILDRCVNTFWEETDIQVRLDSEGEYAIYDDGGVPKS